MNSVPFPKSDSSKNTETSISKRKPSQTQAGMRDRKQERVLVAAFEFLKPPIKKKNPRLLSILSRCANCFSFLYELVWTGIFLFAT